MLRSFICLALLGVAGLAGRTPATAKPLIPVGVHSPLQGHRDVVTGVVAPSTVKTVEKTVCVDTNGDGRVDTCRKVRVPAEPTLASPKRSPNCQCANCTCINCNCGMAKASTPQRSVVKHRVRLLGRRR